MKTPSREWIVERLADYKACRSHREITAIESMFGQFIADLSGPSTAATPGPPPEGEHTCPACALTCRALDYARLTATAVPALSADEVEEYIRSLTWSGDAEDHHKTLVAGNIRAFVSWLEDRSLRGVDDDKVGKR